jgi:UPF0716 protein FxsA
MARLLAGLAFLALPIVELFLLVKTGQAIGFWPTLGLVVGAALLGIAIMSRQGLTVARRTREAVATGRPPVGPVLDGAFLLLAGVLLIWPGFITDIFALALLIPPVRNKVARWGVRRFAERTHAQAKIYEARMRREREARGAAPSDGPVIEGEFERLGEKGPAPHPGKDLDRI